MVCELHEIWGRTEFTRVPILKIGFTKEPPSCLNSFNLEKEGEDYNELEKKWLWMQGVPNPFSVTAGY